MPGVGQIQNYGTADYAMRIWVKPERLASLGLTVPDLMNAVKQQSTVNPSGGIGTEPAPKGQEFTYTVRAQGRLVTAEEFGNVVVRLNPDGSVVRLKDVSRIELGALNYQQRARLNGKPSCPIGVFQVPGSNAIAVAEGVKKTMEELKERFPDDLDYVVALDTTLPVTEGIKEIEHTLFEAIVLVIIVVFLFLQGWRATLIPLLAVPVSLVGTFMFFPMLGFSINTLSLFGLVLAIGLVVDDAIVVVEAVEHHIEHGLSPKDATLKAMEEVTEPVIGIALVLSAVFIPVAFMGGIQGRMNMQFASLLRGLHGRHPGPDQHAVRHHDRRLGPDLGLQRPVALAGALFPDPEAQEGVEGAAREVLRLVQPGLREDDQRLRQPLRTT